MTPSSTGSFTVAALTAATFMLLLLVVIMVARFKKVPLPFTRPRLSIIIQWVFLFVLLAIIQEMVGGYLGGQAAPKWDTLTAARLLRAATIVLLAPLAEELAFRGTMFGVLAKKGLHPALTILLTSAVFTLAHSQYFGLGLLIIFADGVIFGLARHRTKSLFVPVLLHTLGNAYAVGERIFG